MDCYAVRELRHGRNAALDEWSMSPCQVAKRNAPTIVNGDGATLRNARRVSVKEQRVNRPSRSNWLVRIVTEPADAELARLASAGARPCGVSKATIFAKTVAKLSCRNAPVQMGWQGTKL